MSGKANSNTLDGAKWFNVMTSHLSIIFYALDNKGNFLLSEGAALKKLGLSPGEVVGASAFEVYRDFPDILEALNRALAGETVYFKHQVGEFYVENYMVPQLDEKDEVEMVICAGIDVCERMAVEQQLQRERTLRNALNDSVPGILYLYDSDGKLVFWNKKHEGMTGYTAEELSKMSITDWFEGDEATTASVVQGFKKALNGETSYVDAYIRIKSGEHIPMHLTGISLQIEEKPHVAGIGIDISELKDAQRQLLQINSELEAQVEKRTRELTEANRELQKSYENIKAMQGYLIQSEKMAALGNLVAGVAHEINTPVGIGVTAVTYIDEISREFSKKVREGTASPEMLLEFTEEVEQATGIILKNLNRASRLVKSFKQVSADQASEPKRRFNVREYLDEIIISLSPKLNRTKHKLSIVCQDALVLDSYPGAFAQILSNLVLNSITHAFAPGQQGNIEISIEQIGDRMELRYQDDGCGVAEEVLAKIFDPFFTTKRNIGGTGLGLSVVYNLVTQQFGGTIECSSEQGKGMQYIIRFNA